MATKTSLLGLTKPAYTEAADIAVLNANFDLIDKAVGNGKFVKNELDNSYFRDFINQRGASSTEGTWSYGIDRWICVGTAGQLVWHNSDHIALGALRGITQPLTNKYRFIGKVWTLAVMDTSGNLSVVSSMFGGDNQAVYGVQNGLEIRLYSVGNSDLAYFNVNNISSDTNLFKYLAWAALYEGAYTAETLPAYVYKGYAAELAECQRYFIRIGSGYYPWGYSLSPNNTDTQYRVSIPVPVTMRTATPTVTVGGTISNMVLAVGSSFARVNGIVGSNAYANFVGVMFSTASAIGTAGTAVLYATGAAHMDISADL